MEGGSGGPHLGSVVAVPRLTCGTPPFLAFRTLNFKSIEENTRAWIHMLQALEGLFVKRGGIGHSPLKGRFLSRGTGLEA